MPKSPRQRTGQAKRRAVSQAESRAQSQATAAAPARRTSERPRREAVSRSDGAAHRQSEMLKWIGTGLLVVGIAVVAAIVISNRDDGSTSSGNVATVVAATPLPEGIPQNGTVLGDPNAPLLIVEYGDYQCPFCRKFATGDMSRLIQDYIATGKARLEYRQFPIIGSTGTNYDQSGESFRAAEAAYCAADQNLFWPMHDALFMNAVGEFKKSFTDERLKRIAATVPGMDISAFATCLDTRTHVQTVLDSAGQAETDKINSTPSFVINGRTVREGKYSALKKIIDEELAGKQ